MCAENPVYAFWKEYDGRKVVIDGLDCVLCARSYEASYPYRHMTCNVHAVPTDNAKRTAFYRDRRRELGDDWFTDIGSSGPEVQEDVLRQLG